MTDEQKKNKDEFKQFIDRIPTKPISNMRPIKEGFSLDTESDSEKNKK